MNSEILVRMYDYNVWAHCRVWECALALPDEAYFQPHNYSVGSVHEQLVHTMGADWVWLSRLNGVSPEALPSAAEYPTRAGLRTKWDEVQAATRAYIATLDASRLDEMLHYTSINGRQPRQTPVWQVILHVINHGTDHRAQTLALIHQRGGATVEQDLIRYAWEA